MSVRDLVVAEAQRWLGTPYHHHARVLGAGVDCAQILLAVYCDALRLTPPLDIGNYSPQWHLHRSEEVYLRWLAEAGARPVQTPGRGDIAMFRFGRTFSHSAICCGDVYVHAYVDLGVISSRLADAPLAGRPVQFWSLF